MKDEKKINEMDSVSVIIGDGKLARHLPFILDFLGTRFVNLSHKKYDNLLQVLQVKASPEAHLQSFKDKLNLAASKGRSKTSYEFHFHLAVNDENIHSVYENLKKSLNFLQTLNISCHYYHFSGAQSFPGVVGIHPLMTFDYDLYSKEIYEQVPLYVDDLKFHKEHLKHTKYIDPKDKPQYHAFCVLLGNFTQHLIYEAFKSMPKHLEAKDFNLLVQKSVQNILQSPMKETLTGPISRQDLKTLDLHKKHLTQTPVAEIYNLLSEHFINEAKYDGTL